MTSDYDVCYDGADWVSKRQCATRASSVQRTKGRPTTRLGGTCVAPMEGTRMETDRIRALLEQQSVLEAALANGTGPWTVISDGWSEENHSSGAFAAFCSPEYQERALGAASWDLSVGGGFPGFVQEHADGGTRTRYTRNVNGPDVEPIVLVQMMYGVADDAYLVSEEFRLLMELWQDPATGDFYTFGDDGTKERALERRGEQVRVRTPLLRRYQAARQLGLLLFTDSTALVETDEDASDFADLRVDDVVVDSSVVDRAIGRVGFPVAKLYSRLLVKRVLPPPPRETCGIWPWDREDEEFPEFIIGEDDNGKPVRFTCDPEKLQNYYGKNPEAPHYLTPVFFRAEVLSRYYENPGLYEVSDGRLSCVQLWSVAIDNGVPGLVSVFLGDLGRDIPGGERAKWLAHNVPPVAPMSESAFRRSFLGQSVSSDNPEHVFKQAYRNLERKWLANWGWPLHRQPSGRDAGILQRLHIPLGDGDGELEGQVLNLAKVLIDLLNEADLTAGMEKVEDEKGIGKLKRFLSANGYEHTERDVARLRRIQKLRSRTAAHTQGESGARYLAEELGGGSGADLVARLMVEAAETLRSLAEFAPPGEAPPL